MANSGYNEADTRAKLIDPALHERQWIELVKDEQARTLREEAKALRKADKIKKADALVEQAQAADKASHEALGKARAIEDAVYDLKAVNPREKKITDIRTPAELLAAIEEKGKEVDAALAKLHALL
jgi:type I restriction enzyme M protein